MSNIKGLIINSRKLIHWEALLSNWISYINRYCDMMEGQDAPFINTERSNVGVLASAAWKTGWLALEAFNSKKKGKKLGRCDLYFLTDDDKEEFIESKQKWSGKDVETINRYISETIKYAKELPKNYKRIGVLFICPNFNAKYESHIDNKIEEIITIVTSKQIICDAIAWTFPAITRKIIWGDDRIYPGIILIAKCVD